MPTPPPAPPGGSPALPRLPAGALGPGPLPALGPGSAPACPRGRCPRSGLWGQGGHRAGAAGTDLRRGRGALAREAWSLPAGAGGGSSLAPRPGSPTPPVALTPTLPNPICKLAARRPRQGPHPRSPSSRGWRIVSPSRGVPGSRSQFRAARTGEPGRGEATEGRATTGFPAVRDPFHPFKLPPSHTALQISLYFGMVGGKIQICLFASLIFLEVGKGRRFLRATTGGTISASSRTTPPMILLLPPSPSQAKTPPFVAP